MAVSLKESRIEFRLLSEQKKILEDAARLSNLSVSSYILSVCLKQAKYDLEQNEIIMLNNNERDCLLSALKTDIEPNEALVKLFK